jgi:murein DD-endopeptidase MepM/ murein hydrolase activator NlpD
MPKNKFRFNTETLEYEKVTTNYWAIAAKVLGFVSLAAVLGILGVMFSFQWLSSPKERILQNEISVYKSQIKVLEKKTEAIQGQLAEMQKMDDEVYREIFGADPIDDNIRRPGVGGVDKYASLGKLTNGKKLKALHQKLDEMSNSLKVQGKSYEELIALAKEKSKMLASIPAIQPIPNKTLKRIASGFGYRLDPIYRTRKMHTGLDFSAPTGTKIYATGDGRIEKVRRDRWGYGQHVIINHGYGYKTLYAHMSRINVRPGERVKRGQLIGLVGSTGKSTGPHLHYEVIKHGKKVNPVGYFYNDLTADQYEEILKLSSHPNQSFD